MKNQSQSYENEQSESSFKNISDRFTNVIRDIGMEAFEELKTGVDKAWDEIKMGIDEGIQAASTGINNAWGELAQSIERAKDSLLMTGNEGERAKDVSPSSSKGKNSRKKEKDDLN